MSMTTPRPHKFHASLRLLTGLKVLFWTAAAAGLTVAIETCNTRPLPTIAAAFTRVLG